jgi:hypothetical protein
MNFIPTDLQVHNQSLQELCLSLQQIFLNIEQQLLQAKTKLAMLQQNATQATPIIDPFLHSSSTSNSGTRSRSNQISREAPALSCIATEQKSNTSTKRSKKQIPEMDTYWEAADMGIEMKDGEISYRCCCDFPTKVGKPFSVSTQAIINATKSCLAKTDAANIGMGNLLDIIRRLTKNMYFYYGGRFVYIKSNDELFTDQPLTIDDNGQMIRAMFVPTFVSTVQAVLDKRGEDYIDPGRIDCRNVYLKGIEQMSNEEFESSLRREIDQCRCNR